MNKEEKELRLAFHHLEKTYRPFVDFMIEHQESYPEFKGAVTLDGFLIYNPKLLILSYNPGRGKYNEWDKSGAHLANYGERPPGVFEWNSARKNGNWWEVNKKINNDFPANVVEFLYAYMGIERGTKIMDIEKEVMFLNLYPMATENIDAFKRMLRALLKDSDFRKTTAFHTDWQKEWDFRKSLLYLIHNFIENYVQPQKILCLGQSTIEDYVWGKENIYIIGDDIFHSKNYPNVYGISRSGTWSERARRVAKLIK